MQKRYTNFVLGLVRDVGIIGVIVTCERLGISWISRTLNKNNNNNFMFFPCFLARLALC